MPCIGEFKAMMVCGEAAFDLLGASCERITVEAAAKLRISDA